LTNCCCLLTLQDERLHSLVTLPDYTTHEQVLTKMYMQQILRKHEMEAFEKVTLH
jgi:hypothetical protein